MLSSSGQLRNIIEDSSSVVELNERQFAPPARARNHIGLAIRAFLRLEMHWFNTGISWDEAKTSIVREAVRSYLAFPWLTLSPSA
jgi:hypothetical protein